MVLRSCLSTASLPSVGSPWSHSRSSSRAPSVRHCSRTRPRGPWRLPSPPWPRARAWSSSWSAAGLAQARFDDKCND